MLKRQFITLTILILGGFFVHAQNFNTSYKAGEMKSHHYDESNNLYSNYKYNVSFDGPNHWNHDMGVSEHTIFRTYELDSAITIAINVLEVNLPEGVKPPKDIMEVYENDKDRMDYLYKVVIPKQYNTKVEDFKAVKSYLNNRVSLKRTFVYTVKEDDIEYLNKSIVYQTIMDNCMYTIGLDVPDMFYKEAPNYYKNLFNGVRFMIGKSTLPVK